MGYLAGLLVALFLLGLATALRYAHERSFQATVLMLVASYYVLFAAMAADTHAMVAESLVGLVFIAIAVVGFKRWPWLTIAAIAGHGAFDAVHHLFIANPGMPTWWPAFCGTFDVVAGIYLAVLMSRRENRAR
jgi:hypothetical protein